MKDTLRAIFSFFLKTALFFSCGMLVVILSPYIRFAGALPSPEYVFARIASHGDETFFTALFLSLVSTHFRIIRKPGKKALSFTLLFAAAFCGLYGGLYALGAFFPAEKTEARTFPGAPSFAGAITRAGDAFVWAGAGEENRIAPVVVMDRKKGAGNFRVYSEGYIEAGSRTLSVGGEKIPLGRTENAEAEDSPFIRFFTDDIIFNTNLARPKTLMDIPALCSTFSLVFFGFSLWALAKLSRWPLFNLWFTLAALWFVLSGTRFLNLYIVPELLRFESIAWAAGYLPAAFSGFCGCILFLAGILGKPLKEWTREMRYE